MIKNFATSLGVPYINPNSGEIEDLDLEIREIIANIKKKGKFYFCACLDNRVVGYFSGRVDHEKRHMNKMQIYIHPTMRKQGISERMAEEIGKYGARGGPHKDGKAYTFTANVGRTTRKIAKHFQVNPYANITLSRWGMNAKPVQGRRPRGKPK